MFIFTIAVEDDDPRFFEVRNRAGKALPCKVASAEIDTQTFMSLDPQDLAVRYAAATFAALRNALAAKV